MSKMRGVFDYNAELKRRRLERRRLESEELARVVAEQAQTKLKNGNCLLNMKCPKCGALEPFDILVTCWTKVYDDGTDTANEHSWDNASPCRCYACGHVSKVGDFRLKKPTKKEAKCRTSKRTCSSTRKR